MMYQPNQADSQIRQDKHMSYCVLDNFPVLSGDVEIHVDQEGHQVAFYCDYTGPIPISSIIETEWFVDGKKYGY